MPPANLVVCRSCHKASSSRRWKCPCPISKPWLACPIHRSLGFDCKPLPALGNHASMKQSDCDFAVHTKRRKVADSIRSLRDTASFTVITCGTDRAILAIDPGTRHSYNTSCVSLKRGSSVMHAPPPKRRELIFKPGPRLASRIATFSDEAV